MDVGFMELLMLAVLALLIFGPERLPGIARNVGRVVGQIRREATTTFDALRDEVDLSDFSSLREDLERERDELKAHARIDARSSHATSDDRVQGSADGEAPTRFDPHAT